MKPFDNIVMKVPVFLRQHRTTVIVHLLEIVLIVTCWNFRVEPSEEAVKMMYSLVAMLGLFTIAVAAFVWSWIPRQKATAEPDDFLERLFPYLLRGLMWHAIVIWMIGAYGDSVYRFISDAPQDAAILAASFFMIKIIVALASPGKMSVPVQRNGLVSALPLEKPSSRDIRFAAAHEAGHALVYAALAYIPATAKLVLKDCADETGALGAMEFTSSDQIDPDFEHHLILEKTFAEWKMMVCLAGKIGESTIFGETSLGGESDHAQWLYIARRYMANHCRGIFYADPKNKFEQEINDEKLESLQAEQTSLLNMLFRQNGTVFRSLVDAALDKRVLSREDLMPFLNQVLLPSEFPRPSSDLPAPAIIQRA